MNTLPLPQSNVTSKMLKNTMKKKGKVQQADDCFRLKDYLGVKEKPNWQFDKSELIPS